MELILMGFIVDLIFLPIKLVIYIISSILGSFFGWLGASIEIFFHKLFHKNEPIYDYYEEYDPTITQEIQELADQIAEMRRGNA